MITYNTCDKCKNEANRLWHCQYCGKDCCHDCMRDSHICHDCYSEIRKPKN